MKQDLSPPCQPTACSWEQLWWKGVLTWLPSHGHPDMAALQVSCCGGQWLRVPQMGHSGCLVWALLATVYNTALEEKHRNHRCGNTLRAGDRHFLGVLQVYMIYNGVFSNTGSAPCPGPLLQDKAFKNLMHFQSLEEFWRGCSCSKVFLIDPAGC